MTTTPATLSTLVSGRVTHHREHPELHPARQAHPRLHHRMRAPRAHRRLPRRRGHAQAPSLRASPLPTDEDTGGEKY